MNMEEIVENEVASTSQESVQESNGSESETSMGNSGKKKSEIHNQFKLCEKTNSYICNYYKVSLKKDPSRSTGNMLKHLVRKHNNVLQKQQPKQPTFPEFLANPTVGKTSGKFEQSEFELKLVDFIVQTNQPFTVTENDYFRAMILNLHPKADIPNADTIKRRIDSLFDKERKKLTDLLKKVPGKLSFVLDGWTSLNQVGFQGIIVQWISEQWEFCERIVDLDILYGRHTGVNLATSFMKILDEFGLAEKISSITTDNASNCDTFFVEIQKILLERGIAFSEEDFRVRCLAHIINLACQDALTSLKVNLPAAAANTTELAEPSDDEDDNDSDEDTELNKSDGSVLSKLREGIIKIRKSTQRRQLFERHCKAADLEHLELVKDVATRWNSTYFMLKRAYNMKIPLDNTLRTEKLLWPYILYNQEWENIQDIIKFLEPFQKMTAYLSHKNLPTMSMSVMVYMELYNHLEKCTVKNGYSGIIESAAMNACDKLNKYYPKSDGLVFVIGTILDPRCKLTWYTCHATYFKPALVNVYKKTIRTHWEKFYKPRSTEDSTSNSSETEKDCPDDLFATQMKRVRVDKRDELQQYLDEKAVSSDSIKENGVLGWWKAHELIYPNLSKMARDFLATPGTEVPVERLFSNGTDLVVPKRRKMKGETVRKCMCLKGWKKSEDQEQFMEFISNMLADKILGNV